MITLVKNKLERNWAGKWIKLSKFLGQEISNFIYIFLNKDANKWRSSPGSVDRENIQIIDVSEDKNYFFGQNITLLISAG